MTASSVICDVILYQGNFKKSKKLMKIVNIDKEISC